MKKRLLSFFTILMGVCGVCFAGQISVQVVQHNLAMDHVSEQSLIIEDVLLNGFFDQGYIVTNSNAAISEDDEMDADLFHAGYGEAFDGASDFFVQVKVFYEASSSERKTESSPCRLDHIEWVLMKVKSGEKIIESTISGSDKKPGSDENVRTVSNKLVSEIKKAL